MCNGTMLRVRVDYRAFLYSLTVKGKPTPFFPTLAAFCFTSINGYMQGRYLTHFIHYELSWFYDPRFLLGHVIFLVGMAINIHSDTVLRNLRKPGETGYKIPYGELCMYCVAVCVLLAMCMSEKRERERERERECVCVCVIHITTI